MICDKRLEILKVFSRLNSWILYSILILCFFPLVILGQITPRGLGMGCAYTALARGVHAPAWNPANLGLPDNSKFSYTFISIGTGVWNNSFSKKMYDRYFVSDEDDIYWTQQDIEDILNHIPSNGLGLDIDVSIRTFSFSVGQFALTIGVDTRSFIQLDKMIFQIPLKGNEFEKTYSLDNTDGKALGFGSLGLSWGQPIKVSFAEVFTVGGTINILYGGVYGKVERADFSVATTKNGFNLNGNYEATYAFGGLGWGIDLGAAARFRKNWQVSIGINNALSSIPWSEKIERITGFITGDSLTVFSIAEDDNEEDAVADSNWTVEGEKFSTRLPLIIRMGGAYRTGSLLISADYVQGFQKSAFSTTKPKISAGVEWKGVSWLPLRMGFVLGGRIGFGTAFGFGIRPGGFVLDIGVMNRGFILPGNSKGLIFALEMGIELQKQKEEYRVKIRDF